MTDTTDYLEEVGAIVQELSALGLQPILIGGMALVILGSRRVTRDFDFLISKPDKQIKEMVAVFYKRGLELAARLNPEGDIVATIDNRKVATSRLQIDKPSSAYFLNPKTGLRIDLLFDFPLAAEEIAGRAKKIKVRSFFFYMASKKDLIRLKEIAQSERASPYDAQDLAFLKALRR